MNQIRVITGLDGAVEVWRSGGAATVLYLVHTGLLLIASFSPSASSLTRRRKLFLTSIQNGIMNEASEGSGAERTGCDGYKSPGTA